MPQAGPLVNAGMQRLGITIDFPSPLGTKVVDGLHCACEFYTRAHIHFQRSTRWNLALT
jgi:hypothetical protein